MLFILARYPIITKKIKEIKEAQILDRVYHTKQNDLVLKCLMENKNRHLTAEEIFGLLKENGGFVGKATIYRKLANLEIKGVVRKFEGGNSACYQYIDTQEACKNHYHLKCIKCNELFHVESTNLDNLNQELKQQFEFSLDKGKSVLYGVCRKCI